MTHAPLFALTEEHQQIRRAIREICDARIAPFAADVDEHARYPQEAHDILVETDFFAPHVPVEYGGVGADALATVVIIEEIATPKKAMSRQPTATFLSLKIRRLTRGVLARTEWIMKPTKAIENAATAMRTQVAENQSTSCPLSSTT